MWYTGTFTSTAAGKLLTELDTQLVKNANWSVFDTPAANKRVYRCVDVANNCLFYLLVDNTNAAYGICELWQGWDNGAPHAGTGASQKTNSTAVNTARMYYGAGGYGISVRDRCFYFVDFTGGQHCYFGQPRRRDVTKNIVLMVTTTNSNTTWNGMGWGLDSANNAIWAFLFDEAGSQKWASSLVAAIPWYTQNIAGQHEFIECQVRNMNTNLIVGDLEGCVAMYYNSTTLHSSGLIPGQIIAMAGVNWIVVAPPTQKGMMSLAQVA